MRSFRWVVGVLLVAWLVLIVLALVGGVGWPELVLIAVLTAVAIWWPTRHKHGTPE